MSEGQPLVDGEGTKRWRDLFVFLERKCHQRRGEEGDENEKRTCS